MDELHLKETLERYEKRLNGHSTRLDDIEKNQAKMDVKIENLCDSLEKLTGTLNKLTYVLVTTLVGFFIWAIQQNLF